MASSSSNSQPNTTLYINNLNDQVNKEELRSQLYALFTTYGKLIDVVALKTSKMRGQAFLVFTDLAAATSALRACDGMMFYDKPLRIQYAKTKSHSTLRREDPNFVPPNTPAARVAASKRPREDEDMDDGTTRNKREKADDNDDDGEEMDMDEDDEPGQKTASTNIPKTAQKPSHRLLCTNLPQEATDAALSMLFQQYRGFQSTAVAPAPTPNAAGHKVKMAQVMFDTPELASVAKEGLNGFILKPGWLMSVEFIN
ncbi:hypothetical protein OF83DRAFT_157437 [Amylostereum chailletii]|nr:hypothetical protein OF83DRAFT_157437 [Amylostereum chailletii]